MVENLKKTFIFKNSILLTLFIISVANLNNLITFDFNFDKKNELIIFVLLLLIYTPIVGIPLYYLVKTINTRVPSSTSSSGSSSQGVIFNPTYDGGTYTTYEGGSGEDTGQTTIIIQKKFNEIINDIQGGNIIEKDKLKHTYVYVIFLLVMSILFIAYSVLIFKYDTTFTKTQSFILFIFTTSLLFLFCRNIVSIILNLLTKSRTPNLIFSIKLFFILNLVYFISYFHFYNKQKKDKETRKKNSIQ